MDTQSFWKRLSSFFSVLFALMQKIICFKKKSKVEKDDDDIIMVHVQQVNTILDSPTIVVSDENTLFPSKATSKNDKKEEETLTVTITTPNFYNLIEKTFEFNLHEKVWKAKQEVLIEFANHPDLKDPLNFGFYMPPFSGRAGKFLDEERLLKEYPMTKETANLEFRYKRRIFRHIQPQDEKRLQKMNTKKYRKKFIESLLTRNYKHMEKLLQKGLDPNFHDEKSGETPLTISSRLDNCMDLLKLLVQYGTYLDFRSKDGKTALHGVAVIGKIDALQNLLDLGASPNSKDAKGLTPLYLSITSGANPLTTEILLKDHAEIGVSDLQGSQEIHQACKIGNVQHLEHLIFYGADVNSTTASGNTPLHICGLENQENCARVLLYRGADRVLTNYAQQSPYDVAILANHFQVAQLINDFDDNQVKTIAEKPEFSTRRRSKKTFDNNLEHTSTSLPTSPVISNRLFHAVSTPGDMHTLGLQRPRKASLSSLPDVLDDYSESETESDDEEPSLKSRAFSAGGIGTRRLPAPIKINLNGAVTLRTRLYASVPGRHFVAVQNYEPAQPGELQIKKNDIVEVLFVGEGGFWEGCINGRVGWFPSYCVQEVKKADTFKSKNRSWFGNKKSSPMDIIGKSMNAEPPKPRIVTLKRSTKGFGFQLRGANSHVPHIDFTPTPQFPALQYIGEVDKNGVAEKAGLHPGDFVLEINNKDVTNATHSYAVSIISEGGATLCIKVITVAPESIHPDLTIRNTNERRNSKTSQTSESSDTASVASRDSKKIPPPPPTRSNATVLTPFRAENSESSVFSDGAVAVTAETVVVENPTDRKTSSKGMWAGSAYKLQGNDRNVQEDNITPAISSKKQNAPCHNLAAEFDEKFKIITKQVNADVSRYPPVQPKSKPSSELPSRRSNNSNGANLSENSQRKVTPPGYNHTMENIRRGRASSLGKGDQVRPVSLSLQSSTIDLENRYDKEFQQGIYRRNTHDPRYRSDPRLVMSSRDPRYRHSGKTDPRIQDPRYREKINKHSSYNDDDMATYQYRRQMMVANFIEDQKFNSLRQKPVSNGTLPSQGTKKARPMSENLERLKYNGTDFRCLPNKSFEMRQSSLEQNEGRQETLLEHEREMMDTEYCVTQEVVVNEPGHRKGLQNGLAPDKLTLKTRPPSDGLVRMQYERQHQRQDKHDNIVTIVSQKAISPTITSVKAIAMPPPPSTPPPMPPPPPDYDNDDISYIPPPPPPPPPSQGPSIIPTKNSFGDSIVNAAAARSKKAAKTERETDNLRTKKDSDCDSVGSIGKNSLYNSSSSISLDSAGSKDSGFDNDSGDHTSALVQAIALRAAKIEAKEKDSLTTTTPLPTMNEASEHGKDDVIENANSPKTYQMKDRGIDATQIDNGYSSPTSRARTKSDLPPATKPKPKRSSQIDPVMYPVLNNDNNKKGRLNEDTATSYLDGIIADAEASIDYDLISITSNSSNGEEKTDSVIKVQPMIVEETDENISLAADDLPPPPLDFLEEKDQEVTTNSTLSDAPPPYTLSAPTMEKNIDVPKQLLTKSYNDWTSDDVCCWLDHLNLSQYKITFTDNDIVGKHLPELTKDELKELGVTKLGHRMTLDDAISRLCRRDILS